MNDETQPMEPIRVGPIHSAGKPWSVQTESFRDLNVGFGYVTVEANHPQAPPDRPWLAYLAPINPRQGSFSGWFPSLAEGKAYINAIADQYRMENAEVKR